MPEFILDLGGQDTARQFRQLDEFTQGYIEAAFFTSEEQLEADGVEAPGFADLEPETLAQIVAECAAFQLGEASRLLEQAYASHDYTAEQAGRDFWFTRNGHGVGYWDREELEGGLGDALSALARAAGESDLYAGDDGRVYVFPVKPEPPCNPVGLL